MNFKKELEDKQQEGLEAARAQVVQQYKAFNEHADELMAAHWVSIEIYRRSVKEAGYLKLVKRHLGQDLAFIFEEKPNFK